MLSCCFAVELYLLFERLQALEFYLAAYFMMKRDADVLVVEVTGKIEYVDFEPDLGAIHRGARADIGDRRQGAPRWMAVCMVTEYTP